VPDEDAEFVVKLVRTLAGAPAFPTAPRQALHAQDETFVGWDWNIQSAADAAATLHDALPKLIEWWDNLFPTGAPIAPLSEEEVRAGHAAQAKLPVALREALQDLRAREQLVDPRAEVLAARAALAQLVGPLALALRHIRYPLGEYVPVQSKQVRGKQIESKQVEGRPWHLPAVLMANILDRGLRRAGHDLEFSHASIPVGVVRTILVRLGLKPSSRAAVAARIRRWWDDHGRLPTE
jgi:hypothetical protein